MITTFFGPVYVVSKGNLGSIPGSKMDQNMKATSWHF